MIATRCRLLAAVGALWTLVFLSGEAAAMIISPSPYDFGDVPINTTVSHDFSVTMDPGFQLVAASGNALNAPFQFSFGTCTSTSVTCTITESFSPTTFGAASGSLTLSECPIGGGLCTSTTLSLTGNGVSVFTVGPIDFGLVPINTAPTLGVNITLDAGYQLVAASGSALNPPFEFGFGDCTSSSVNCTVTQKFNATAFGAANAVLTLSECPVGGGACHSISSNVTANVVSVSAVPAPPVQAIFALAVGALAWRRRNRRG